MKARLKDLQQDDFLLLLHDLYALNADNRLFLTTHLLAGTPTEMVAPYRKAISQVFNPVTIARSPHPELRPLQIRLDKPLRGGYTYLS